MIYEYKCQSCQKVAEVWQKMSDPAPESCSSCGAKGKLERLISATSFSLKGTGWYTTDYKRAPQAGTPEKNSDKKETVGSSDAGCGAPVCGTQGCQASAQGPASAKGLRQNSGAEA